MPHWPRLTTTPRRACRCAGHSRWLQAHLSHTKPATASNPAGFREKSRLAFNPVLLSQAESPRGWNPGRFEQLPATLPRVTRTRARGRRVGRSGGAIAAPQGDNGGGGVTHAYLAAVTRTRALGLEARGGLEAEASREHPGPVERRLTFRFVRSENGIRSRVVHARSRVQAHDRGGTEGPSRRQPEPGEHRGRHRELGHVQLPHRGRHAGPV